MRSGYYYMVMNVCLFKCVYSHPHPISVPPPLPSMWCITCDTHAKLDIHTDTTLGWAVPVSYSHNHDWFIHPGPFHTIIFLWCLVCLTSGPLARPCLGLLQASNQASLHLTSKSSPITTSVTGKHIKNIKHIKPS